MADEERFGLGSTSPSARPDVFASVARWNLRAAYVPFKREAAMLNDAQIRKTIMPKLTKRRRVALVVLAVMVTIAFGGGWYYKSLFPYGWSYSCDKQLMFALVQYAEDNTGAYPAGEATPEASLSLLYPKYANEYVLQGKTVPLEVVKTILERGNRLGPESCGWHYVEGLRLDDDYRLALCWDKVGLGHNGQRQSDDGHTVLFVSQRFEYIEGARWEEFLQEQTKLLEERNERRKWKGAN